MRSDDPLSRGLRKLRSARPSAHFSRKLELALADVDRQHSASKGARGRNALHLRLVLTVPALASVAVAAHLLVAEPDFDVSQVAEHVVHIPRGGSGALDLGLMLHHHNAEFANVRVDVPHGLTFKPSPDATAEEEADCHSTGCVYAFMHPTDDDAPHVRVEVQKPGRYRMNVEHESEGRLVREIFVLHARH